METPNSAQPARKRARKPIWTPRARRYLFEELTQRFGPFSEWQATKSPASDRKAEYADFLFSVARVIGANSADAVQQQIEWAITTQAKISNEGMTRTAVLNKAAAFEAGFIDSAYLPRSAAFEYKS